LLLDNNLKHAEHLSWGPPKSASGCAHGWALAYWWLFGSACFKWGL